MDKKIISDYKKAGEIAEEIQALAKKKLKIGTNLYSFAEEMEKAIITKGGFPAFPINLSRNNSAAHYTPSFESEEEANEDVIKVDVGVHVNGYIADCAQTIDLSGKYSDMVTASKDALENAIKLVKEGALLGKIGATIEETIKAKGFNSVQNLSGHGVDYFDAHVSPTIPNVGSGDSRKLEDGIAIAIEPFATNGRGFVKEGGQAEIFQLEEKKPLRSKEARKIFDFIEEEYSTLPFAERWLHRELDMSEFSKKVGLRELMQKQCVKVFPELNEEQGKIVTQAETTLLLTEGKVIRLL